MNVWQLVIMVCGTALLGITWWALSQRDRAVANALEWQGHSAGWERRALDAEALLRRIAQRQPAKTILAPQYHAPREATVSCELSPWVTQEESWSD